MPKSRKGSQGDASVLVALRARTVAEALSELLTSSGLSAQSVPLSQTLEGRQRTPSSVLLVDGDAELAELMQLLRPFQGADVPRVVLLTRDDTSRYRGLAERVGADAVISHDSDIEEFVNALAGRTNGDGSRTRGASASSAADEAISRLTPREQEVLDALARGLRNTEIAVQLEISPNTVRTHVQNLLTKLGARSRFEAVSIGRRAGLLWQPPHGGTNARP